MGPMAGGRGPGAGERGPPGRRGRVLPVEERVPAHRHGQDSGRGAVPEHAGGLAFGWRMNGVGMGSTAICRPNLLRYITMEWMRNIRGGAWVPLEIRS